ncbi:hypothetical protein WJX75_005589 [Coccomyxa subellipsoidea]|uniref:Plant heme peroxidase family profile domain-containing protein n=1 Tax=Coccomyxa subellipsoidea TaxID=248742 RepID=A0ABR2YGH8_9CHLO
MERKQLSQPQRCRSGLSPQRTHCRSPPEHKRIEECSEPMAPSTPTEVRSSESPSATSAVHARTTKKDQLKLAREDVKKLVSEKYCHPIIVRLAWHDSGTYDKGISDFPEHGGANGSIRLPPELDHKVNKGLEIAVNLLQPIADKYDDVSYADLYQMAAVTAIDLAGGPHIPLRYGRKDAPGPESPIPIGRLPSGGPPWHDGAPGPAEHLRNIFYRMGFNDQEIVVLSGGQTLGRCHPERSGFGKPVTKYTAHGPGAPGGSPWTPDWLTFDNMYFRTVKAQDDPDLVVLETDDILFKDPGFRWKEKVLQTL